MSYRAVAKIDYRKVDTPEKIVGYMQGAFDTYPMQETFWVLFLTRKMHAMGRHMVTLGTMTGTLVSPKEVLRAAILAGAAHIAVAHNHPSGITDPSSADVALTRELREACKVMDIPLVDHVILGDADAGGKGYYSFRESGLI